MCKRFLFLLSWGLSVLALGSSTAFGQAGATMYDIQIAGGNDDAEEHLNAGMDVTSSDLEIVYEDNGTPATDEQLIGMLWAVPIAKDFVIGKAYIQFEMKETKGNGAPVNVIIEGQLSPNSPAFSGEAKNITNRPRTKAQVKWTIPTGMPAGTKFQTPDISPVIMEIIGQDGWASGNALVIILRDDKDNPSTGIRCVNSYDGSVSGSPLLHIQPPWPWATAPSPADGGMGSDAPLFGWTPGEGAVLHNVYMGTSAELTEADLVARDQPIAMYYHVPGFEPGTKYYWRIDEVDAAGKMYTGAVWSFSIPSLKAFRPVPRSGGKYAPLDVTLTWSAGSGGVLHTVYFGTSFDEVENAGGGAAQPTTTYSPVGPLAQNTTYYWRIDESDGVTTHKGDVWSFTTMPEITITDPNLIGWWKFDEGAGTKAVDFSGHGNDGIFGGNVTWVEGFVGSAVQLSNGYVMINGIVDDLKSTDLTLSIWIKTTQTNEGEVIAANDSGSNHPFMLGVSSRKIYVNDGSDTTYDPQINDNQWHMITYVRSGFTGTIYCDGVPVGSYTPSFSLDSVTRWSIGQEWDDSTASNFYIGAVDDARVYGKALTADEVKELMRGDPALAWKPSPEHRSVVDVLKLEQGLTWAAGDEAAQHDVYLGLDQAAVTAAGVSDQTGVYRGRQQEAGYMPAEKLAWGTGPYFWRIDEVQADGTVTTGNVWSFSVANFLSVDDMESYDDDLNRIYDAWIDNYDPEGDQSGSVVGNATAPFAEQKIVHAGRQSLPMNYNNAGPKFLFSEARQTFAPVQDWTAEGVTDLSLWFRGNPVAFADKGDGAFTVSGAGHDIWDDADDFRFVFKRLNGDGSVVAKVESIDNTNVWAKAGVMIRESLDASSPMAYMIQSAASGVSFGWRSFLGATCGSQTVGGILGPQWVKLTRTGSALTAQYSADGQTWTDIKDPTTGAVVSTAISMTGSIYVGLCVTSHDAALIAAAEFSGVTTAGGVSGAWEVAEIGDDPQGGNSPAPVYVAVEDSAGKIAVTTHADPAVAVQATWTEWRIPLSSLTGINLAKIKALHIGVGDRDNPVSGGSGRIYIDDIRLDKP